MANENKILHKLSGLTFIASGIVESLLSLVLLPFCKPMGEMLMNCNRTSLANGIVGIVIVLIGIAYIALPKKMVRAALSLIIAALGLLSALIPTLIIGVCPHVHMKCHSLSSPVLLIVGIVIAIAAALNAGIVLKRRGGLK